jgi:hypothetical protein
MTSRNALLKKELFEALKTALQPLGYLTGSKAEQRFTQKFKFGVVSFHYPDIVHPGIDFDVTVDVALRFEAVQSRLGRYLRGVSEKEKKKMATIGLGLGRRAKGMATRWTIARSEDIAPAISGMLHDYESEGLDFIQKFSDPERVFQVLRSHSREARDICVFDADRCENLIAFAAEYDLFGDLENLHQECVAFLSGSPQLGALQSYEKTALPMLADLGAEH